MAAGQFAGERSGRRALASELPTEAGANQRQAGDAPLLTEELRGRGDDAAEAPGGEIFQDETNGFDADGCGDARAFVKEQNGAGREAPGDRVGDVGGPAMRVLGSAGAPADAGEAARAEDGSEENILDADGRTKARRAPGVGGNRGKPVVELAAKASGGCAPKRGERMGVRVVADFVAGGGDVAEERGVGGGSLSDDEEGGAGPVDGEEGEEAGRVGGVGTVVDGKPDFAGGCIETPVNAKETLRVGDKDMIGEDRVGHEPEREREAESGGSEEDGGDFAAEVERDDEHGGGA